MIKEFKTKNKTKRETYILVLIRTNYKKGGRKCETKYKIRAYIGKLKITQIHKNKEELNGYSKNRSQQD